MVETINKVRKAASQLLHSKGHEATVAEIAKEVDLTEERVQEILRISQEPVFSRLRLAKRTIVIW